MPHHPDPKPAGAAHHAADRRVGAWMAALGLALTARQGVADDDAMRWATIAVLGTFAVDDPLAIAVRDMGRRWRDLRAPFRCDQLIEAGTQLSRAIERSSWPAPAGRADIEG